MNEITKICSRLDCEFAGIEQPLENFKKQKTGKLGHTSMCKSCDKIYHREYNRIHKKPKKLNDNRKIPIEEIVQRIFEKHGNIISLDVLTYKNTHTKCRFFDKDYGEFWATPSAILRGVTNSKRGHIRGGEKQKYSIEEIKNRIYAIHAGTIILDESTYIDVNHKARFIDIDFGEWWVKPFKILSRKDGHPKRKSIRAKETCLKKYGVNHISQVPEIASKQAKSANNSTILYHWKTNEELVCRASYEPKVIKYLNQNQIDYDFQIRFSMPDGRVYFCDLYLKNEKKYVEVKGYFRKDAREKWDWFHSEYPNSELWNEKKLKEMKIL